MMVWISSLCSSLIVDVCWQVEFIIRRVPHGRVFALKRETEGQALGVIREGNTAEIREVKPSLLPLGVALFILFNTRLSYYTAGAIIKSFSCSIELWNRHSRFFHLCASCVLYFLISFNYILIRIQLNSKSNFIKCEPHTSSFRLPITSSSVFSFLLALSCFTLLTYFNEKKNENIITFIHMLHCCHTDRSRRTGCTAWCSPEISDGWRHVLLLVGSHRNQSQTIKSLL